MRLREEDHLERARDLKEELDVMEADYWTNRDRRYDTADHLSFFGATYSSPWRGIEAPASPPAAASYPGGVSPCSLRPGLVANASREGL